MGERTYQFEFYETEDGREPVVDWMRELEPHKRQALGRAMKWFLQTRGQSVCESEWGDQLGDGLFEFRLRRTLATVTRLVLTLQGKEADDARREPHDDDPILLRVFCHAYGDRIILLLNGYDKGEDPSPSRQRQEIALARRRLEDWKARRSAAAKADKKKGK